MKKVLFVCVENSCRSQIAEGFARKLGEHIIDAYSAGSKASGKVNQTAVEVMKEAGIDISGQRSKGFADVPAKDIDYVVTMGCGDVCPFIPAKKHIDWKIEDPRDRPIEFFRQIRDEIKERVEGLIKEVLAC